MSRNEKYDPSEHVELPMRVGGIAMLLGGVVLLLTSTTYTPTDLPLTPMKWLKEFSPSIDPTLPRRNLFGPSGTLIGFLQLQILGMASFLFASGLLIFAWRRLWWKERETVKMWGGLIGATICLSGFIGCHETWFDLWASSMFLTDPGGILGQLTGEYLFQNLLAKIGSSILFISGYILSLSFFCGIHTREFFQGCREIATHAFQRISGMFRWFFGLRSGQKQSLSDLVALNTTPSLFDQSLSSDSDPSPVPLPPPQKSVAKGAKKKKKPVEAPPVQLEFDEPLIIDGATKRVPNQQVLSEKPFNKKPPPRYAGLTTDGFEDYELPGFDLLEYDDSEEDVETNRDELFQMQRTIIETLRSFGVEVTAGDITRGPTITRFEVYPALGLKVSRISALEADLARVTKAESINILAPIPGKDTVGIEVANANRVLVPYSEILLDDKFRNSKRKIPLALGKNVYGEAVIGDLAAMPHCLVAGATGAGKSVCINTIIASILFKFGPDELRFIMVDPKVVEMQMYSKLPHLVVPVLTDPQKVVGALKWCVNEMERRYKLFAKCSVRNFDSFNQRELAPKREPAVKPEEIDHPLDPDQIESIAIALEEGDMGREMERDDNLAGFPEEDEDEIPDRLPYIVIIIDELADLMQTAPADVELCIARIAQKARAAGMHLIVATQTPRADVVTGIIKANIPSRIAFQVSSKLDSRVILDIGGAEKLIGKGDMLFLPPGSAKLERSQGAFVSDEEVEAIVDFCSNQVEQKFENAVQESMDSEGDTEGGSDDVTDADAELLRKCLEVVTQEGKASTSLLQRRLRLGYTRAARIVDIMEKRGYVGPADGAKPREVFVGN